MKKTMELLTAVVLALFLLVGCSGDKSQPAPNQLSEPGAQSTSAAQETGKSYTPGTWVDETHFESPFWGLSFTLPEKWLASTPEELGYVTDAGGELLSDEQRMQAERAFEEGKSVTEMGVTNISNSNILMVVDNFTGVPGGTMLTAELYADILREQLQQVPGMAYEIAGGVSKRTIADKEFTVLTASVEDYGMTQWYAMIKQDSYMCTLVCTFATEGGAEAMEDVLTHFTAL